MIPINSEDTIARTYSCTAPALAHLRLRRCAPPPTLSRTHATNPTHLHPPLAHPYHHTRAPASPFSRIYTYAAAHLRPTLTHPCHRRYAPTPYPRTHATAATHPRLRRYASASPLPSRVALALSVFRTLFYVASRSLVRTCSTNSLKDLYNLF